MKESESLVVCNGKVRVGAGEAGLNYTIDVSGDWLALRLEG